MLNLSFVVPIALLRAASGKGSTHGPMSRDSGSHLERLLEIWSGAAQSNPKQFRLNVTEEEKA